VSGLVRVLGLILGGGQSSRMGADKALVDFGGKPMAAHVAATMHELGAVEVMLGGAAPGVGAALGLAVATEPKPGFGPMSGLAAGMTAARRTSPPFDIVVVCPCDTPAVAVHDLRVLVDCLDDPGIDVACFGTSRGLEPLISAWRPETCASAIADAIAAGRGAVRDVIGQLRHIICGADNELTLANINTTNDLRSALTTTVRHSKGIVARPSVEEPS